MPEHKLEGTRRDSQNVLLVRGSDAENSVYLKINPPDHHYKAIHVDLDELRKALDQIAEEQ